MAKKQDFASKLAKGHKTGPSCPNCGNLYSFVKKVESYFSDETQNWKYKTQNLKVCQCNEKEVYA